MAQWVLKANGNVVPRRTARPLTVAETHSTTELKKRGTFNALVEKRWGTSMSPPPGPKDDEQSVFDEYEDDDESKHVVPDVEDTVDVTGKLLNQQPAYDRIINPEVALQLEEMVTTGKVTRRALSPDGQVAGTYDDNPFLNTIIYEVEFPDGQVKDYAANVIAENMLTQVDSDGFTLTMMDSIINYERDDAIAIPKSNAYVATQRSRKRHRRTTVGWKLLVKWSDGSETWVLLKEMKESHPLEVADFAKARGIADESAFSWWVPYMLQKRDVIISKVKSRIRKTTHKYGVEMATSVDHAYEINKGNGNTLWCDAIKERDDKCRDCL